MAGIRAGSHTRRDEPTRKFLPSPVGREKRRRPIEFSGQRVSHLPKTMQIQFARNGAALVPSLPEEIVPSLLQSKTLLPSDHYWHEGMADWMPVEAHWPAPTWNSRPPSSADSAAGFSNLSGARAAI